MEDKQMNDPKDDSPTRDAAGGALAGLFVVAVVWLFLLLACFQRCFLGVGTIFHNPWVLAICTAAVIVLCAAVGVSLSREQKGGQNENQSKSASLLKRLFGCFGFAIAVVLFFLIVLLFLSSFVHT